MARLSVDAGRHQLRCRGDHRERLLRVDEVVELRLALHLVTGDPHHVAMILGDERTVLRDVDERLAHALGVVDVLAEHDRLVHRVLGMHVRRDPLSDHLRATRERDVTVEVELVVDLIRDVVAEVVDLALLRPPPEHVLVEIDADNLERGEEAVLDSLLQRVGVDGVAEVVDVRDVLRLLRCCRHA